MKSTTAKEVSAFDAKTHLSALLRETEKGQSFVIHRRGKPVAWLRFAVETSRNTILGGCNEPYF